MVEVVGGGGEYMHGVSEFRFALEPNRRYAKAAMKAGYYVEHYERWTPGRFGWEFMAAVSKKHHRKNPCHLLLMDHYNDFDNEEVNGGMCCYWHRSVHGKKAAEIFPKAPL